MNILARLRTRQQGAVSVEYAIVVVFIAAVIVVAVVFLGHATNHNIDCTGQSLSNVSQQC